MSKTKITNLMKELPLQSSDTCDNCLLLKQFLAGDLADKEGSPPLAILRKGCADCNKFNGKGIYKADLVLDALKAKQDIKRHNENISQYYGKGRQPRIAIEKGLHIHKLHDEHGMNAEKISRLMGISHTTIRKILQMSMFDIQDMISADLEKKALKKQRREQNKK